MESLAQDERNAHMFYSHFAENTENESIKKSLSAMAKDSEARLNQYLSLIAKHFNRAYTPKETKVNTSIPTVKAINLALTEENKSLITLSGLLDQLANTELEKIIQRIISKKIISHQLLITIQKI